MEAANAFRDMERPCIRAAIEVNPALHPLIPIYDVLYNRGSGQIWFYDDLGNFIICVFYSRGVRHGCVLDTTILCVTTCPIYDAPLGLLGPYGFLFNYADDVYI